MDIWPFLQNALTAAIGAGLGTAALAFLGKTWIESRVKASIDYEYAIKLEGFKAELLSENARRAEESKRELQIRDRAAKIAELIAEWYSWPESQKQLNALTFEAFLWMPDDVLNDLSAVLSHSPGAPDVREVLSKARKHLLGYSNLEVQRFIVFTQEATERSLLNKLKQNTVLRGSPAGPSAENSNK
jgi:hypothetical protein